MASCVKNIGAEVIVGISVEVGLELWEVVGVLTVLAAAGVPVGVTIVGMSGVGDGVIQLSNTPAAKNNVNVSFINPP